MATSERGLVERLRERTAHANTEAKRLWPHDPGVLLSTHEVNAIVAALSAAEARAEAVRSLFTKRDVLVLNIAADVEATCGNSTVRDTNAATFRDLARRIERALTEGERDG